MALSTYAELQTAVLRWLARSDLSPDLPTMIRLAEQRIFDGAAAPLASDALRVKEMLATATMYAGAEGIVTLPANMLQVVAFWIDGAPARGLDPTSPDALRRLLPYRSERGGPYFTIHGRGLDPRIFDGAGSGSGTPLLISGAPDVSYMLISQDPVQYLLISGDGSGGGTGPEFKIMYYERPVSLTEEGGAGLLAAYPNVYLYAALLEAAPFLVEDPRLATWHGMYKAAVEGANRTDTRRRLGSGQMQMRVLGATP